MLFAQLRRKPEVKEAMLGVGGMKEVQKSLVKTGITLFALKYKSS